MAHLAVEGRKLVLRETAEDERSEVVEEREVERLEGHVRSRRGVDQDVEVLVVLLGGLLNILRNDEVLRRATELLGVGLLRIRVRQCVDLGAHRAGDLEGKVAETVMAIDRMGVCGGGREEGKREEDQNRLIATTARSYSSTHPPIPMTPTFLPGPQPWRLRGAKTVTPAHINGAASAESRCSGSLTASLPCWRVYSAYPPWAIDPSSGKRPWSTSGKAEKCVSIPYRGSKQARENERLTGADHALGALRLEALLAEVALLAASALSTDTDAVADLVGRVRASADDSSDNLVADAASSLQVSFLRPTCSAAYRGDKAREEPT